MSSHLLEPGACCARGQNGGRAPVTKTSSRFLDETCCHHSRSMLQMAASELLQHIAEQCRARTTKGVEGGEGGGGCGRTPAQLLYQERRGDAAMLRFSSESSCEECQPHVCNQPLALSQYRRATERGGRRHVTTVCLSAEMPHEVF